MAIHYVYSGAGGSNDGTSKANAWTSLFSAVGVGAGDTIFIHKDHSNTISGALSFSNGTQSNPVRLICIDFDTDQLATGATLSNSTNSSVTGNIIAYGLAFSSTNTLSLGQNGAIQHYRNCSFTRSGAGFVALNINNGRHRLEYCSIDCSSATAVTASVAVGGSVLEIIGGTITNRSGSACINSAGADCVVCGATILGDVESLVSVSAASRPVIFRNCVLPSSITEIRLTSTSPGGNVLLERCVTGTISGAMLGLTASESLYGSVSSTLSRYRTSGADDAEQANEHAWAMAANSSALEGICALESPPIVRWVDSGEQDITIYFASDSTLQNDELWIEVESPSEEVSPTALSKIRSTRCELLATPANLTADGTSTWNGSDVSVPQKITVTIDPAVAGPVTVRCFLAKPSTTVYVDPLIEVS